MTDERRTPMERAIDQRLNSLDSANYRRMAEHVLGEFRTFCERKHGVTDPQDIDDTLCRRYAQHLRDETREGTYAANTANRYYAHVRAFLDWCVRDDRADTNPAERNRATEPLPQETEQPDRQFWSERTRNAFISYLDRQADEADGDRRKIMRDRALVATVAFSGARGAELFRVPGDGNRNGLVWGDVDLDNGVAQVWGKTGEWQPLQLPSPAVTRLDQYRRILDDPGDEMPVFRTFHAPTIAQQANKLVAGDVDDAEAVVREHDPSLLAISVQSARRAVKEYSKAAELTASDGEHLKLHGARRGLGHDLYNTKAELAQEVLRHKSIETTHEAYREERTAELGAEVEDALGLD